MGRHEAHEQGRGCVGVGDQPQRVDLAAIQDAAADAPTPHTAALQDTVRWQSLTLEEVRLVTSSPTIKMRTGAE